MNCREPTVIASYVKTLARTLGEIAPESVHILPSNWLMASTDSRIPLAQINGFWHQLLATSKSTEIGLRVAQNIHAGSFHLVGRLAQQCSTLGEAWEMAIRFYSLVSEAGILLSDKNDQHLILTFQPRDLNPAVTDQQMEAMMGALTRFALTMMEGDFNLFKVELSHAPTSDDDLYQQIFDCPVFFNQPRCRMFIPISELNKVVPLASESLRENHLLAAKDSLQKLNQLQRPVGELQFQVYEYLRKQLPAPLPSLNKCADDLHISNSTLKRKLKKDGVSFSDIAQQVRKDIAFQLLQNPLVPVSSIAYQVGFANPATFYRCFKTWTGLTPAEFRSKDQHGELSSRFKQPHMSSQA